MVSEMILKINRGEVCLPEGMGGPGASHVPHPALRNWWNLGEENSLVDVVVT